MTKKGSTIIAAVTMLAEHHSNDNDILGDASRIIRDTFLFDDSDYTDEAQEMIELAVREAGAKLRKLEQ